MAADEYRGERQKAARRSPPCSRLFAGFLSGFGNRRNPNHLSNPPKASRHRLQEVWQYNHAIDYCQYNQHFQGERFPFGIDPRVFSSADVMLSPPIAVAYPDLIARVRCDRSAPRELQLDHNAGLGGVFLSCRRSLSLPGKSLSALADPLRPEIIQNSRARKSRSITGISFNYLKLIINSVLIVWMLSPGDDEKNDMPKVAQVISNRNDGKSREIRDDSNQISHQLPEMWQHYRSLDRGRSGGAGGMPNMRLPGDIAPSRPERRGLEGGRAF